MLPILEDLNRSFTVGFYSGEQTEPFYEEVIDSLDSETTITIITTWKAEENVDQVWVIVDSENEIIEIDEEDNTMSVGIDVAYGWGMGWVEQARQNPLTLILVIIALIVYQLSHSFLFAK